MDNLTATARERPDRESWVTGWLGGTDVTLPAPRVGAGRGSLRDLAVGCNKIRFQKKQSLGKSRSWGMVEAVGIEPTSEKPSPRALRACPSFFISPLRAGRRHPIAVASLANKHGRRKASPTALIYFNVVPMSAVDQGSSSARADLIKPQWRSCRWQLSRFPFDEWRLGTLPTNCMTTRRIQGAPSCKRTASHATTSSILREFLAVGQPLAGSRTTQTSYCTRRCAAGHAPSLGGGPTTTRRPM